MPPAETWSTIGAEAFRLAAIAFIAAIAYSGARHNAATDGLTWQSIAGFLAVASLIAFVAAGQLGTVRTEIADDPLRPQYVSELDTTRPPPTSTERRRFALIVFAILAIPAAAGFGLGHRDHTRRRHRANVPRR